MASEGGRLQIVYLGIEAVTTRADVAAKASPPGKVAADGGCSTLVLSCGNGLLGLAAG
jgi:acyl CoA:acetate/3-ketoacid CoA transferase beta subunit